MNFSSTMDVIQGFGENTSTSPKKKRFQLDSIETTDNDFELRFSELQSRYQTTQKELQVAQDTILNMEEQINTYIKENGTLRKQNQQLAKENAQLVKEKSEIEEHLTGEMSVYDAMKEAWANKEGHMKSTISQLRSQVKDLSEKADPERVAKELETERMLERLKVSATTEANDLKADIMMVCLGTKCRSNTIMTH